MPMLGTVPAWSSDFDKRSLETIDPT